MREDFELNKTKILLQKQKDIEEEQKLYPKLKIEANLTEPELVGPAISNKPVLKVIKKTRHRANTIQPHLDSTEKKIQKI